MLSRLSSEGSTALHLAALRDQGRTVFHLLRMGAKNLVETQQGERTLCPLTAVVEANQIEVLRILLTHDAVEGKNPLHWPWSQLFAMVELGV